MKKRTICIDFDGVLAVRPEKYEHDVFGEMVPSADVATGILKEKGYTIIIYTTRPATDAMKKWLKDNNIKYDYINENPDQPEDSPIEKGCKIVADMYVDDRAIDFNGDWDWKLNRIAEFTPWSCSKKDEKKEMLARYNEGEAWRKEKEKRLKDAQNAVYSGKVFAG